MKMSALEVRSRKALGEYNSNSVQLEWLVGNVVEAVKDNRNSADAYRHDLELRESQIKELLKQFNQLALEEPRDTSGLLIVSSEEFGKLGLMLKRFSN
jgi:hypothetical protein